MVKTLSTLLIIMNRLPLILFFLVSFFPAYTQDWKSYYDPAVAAYQAQHYADAIVNAEKAYATSKSLDVKNQIYSLQLITAICLESQDYSRGIPYSQEEVKLFLQTEGSKSKHYIEAVSKRAQMFQAVSNWTSARKDYAELSVLLASSTEPASVAFFKVQSNYGQVLLSMNDFDKAGEVLNTAVTGLKQFPDEGEEYLLALYYSAYADDKNKNAARAEARLKEFVLLVEKNGLQSWPEYAQAKTRLVQLAAAGGNTTEALALMQQGNVSEDQKALQYLKAALDFQTTQPSEALRYFKLAEESLAKSTAETNTGYSIFQNYARFLYNNRQINEAQVKLNRARPIALKLYSVSSVEYGYVEELDADIQLASGNAIVADEKYGLAFKNFPSLPPATQANHRTNAAIKFLNLNRPDFARKALESLATNYAILFALPEKNQLEVSAIYSEALITLNQNEIAINHLSRHALNNSSPSIENAINLKLAEVYRSSGDWKKSEALLVEVIKKTTEFPQMHAEASYQIARLQQQMGKYKEAEVNYQEAIAGFKKLQSGELKQVYNSFATFYIILGNYTAAESIYQNLLSDPQTPAALTSALKQNLATIYQQTLRYDKAEIMFKEVLEVDRKTIGEKHPDFAISLQNLAVLYQAMGNFEKAKGLYLQALEVDKLNGGDQTLSYASKSANLGTVYQETGEPQKARLLFESALKIQERMLGKDHPDYMHNVYNLAVLHQGLGEYGEAGPLFRSVSQFYLGQIKEIFPSLSDFEKTAYFNKINKIINDYEEFEVRYQSKDNAALGELYDFRLETKALLLNASTKVRNAILTSGNPDLQAKFTAWLQLKEKLARFTTLTFEEKQSQQSIIVESQQTANNLEKWLSTQSELFGGAFNKQPIGWQDVKKALKPGEAAVEIIRLAPEKDSVIYAALVLRPDQATPLMMIFPRGREMEGREFSFYSNTIRFVMDNNRSYDLYWLPLELMLKGVTTVYLSADGVYNKVNLLTLYDKQANDFLISRLTIRLLSNLRELVANPGKFSQTPSAILFGYPDFRSGRTAMPKNVGVPNRQTTVSEIVKGGVADLPGTREEIMGIEQLLKKNQWNVNSYMFKDASEEKIKSIQSPDILHIATHGFFIPEKIEDTPIIYSKNISLAADNPLTRSGLLLAGVEKNIASVFEESGAEEDGILTALEVMNLNLDHTNLVVLSACETGSGSIRNGEGVYGLQRAFLVSGAKNLIMSLWKVNDEATQELMIGFYNQLLLTKDKVTAFRQAQIELKNKYKDPFYWGAFVLIGR